MDDQCDSLTNSDKIHIGARTLLRLVPYVGGAITTLIYEPGQARRNAKLKAFYEELAMEVENIKDRLADPSRHDPEKMSFFTDFLDDAVSRQHDSEKISFFRNSFVNTLMNPLGNDFDEKYIYITTLSGMSISECKIMSIIRSCGSSLSRDFVQKHAIPSKIAQPCISRLLSYGFIEQTVIDLGSLDDGAENNSEVSITETGRGFCDFCLTMATK